MLGYRSNLNRAREVLEMWTSEGALSSLWLTGLSMRSEATPGSYSGWRNLICAQFHATANADRHKDGRQFVSGSRAKVVKLEGILCQAGKRLFSLNRLQDFSDSSCLTVIFDSRHRL